MPTARLAETDSDLLNAFRAGDGGAFAALYERYRVPSYAYLRRRFGSDGAEWPYLATWRAVARRIRPTPGVEFAAQLFGEAHALAQDVEPVANARELPEDVTQRTRKRAQRYAATLSRIDRDARDAYLLYEEGGLTLAEVGTILGIDPVAARARIQRAVHTLRDALDAPGLALDIPRVNGSALLDDDTRIITNDALHDPQVAVAHFAGREGPPPRLDATVLDEAERTALGLIEEAKARARAQRRRWEHRVFTAALGIVLVGSAALLVVDRLDPPTPGTLEAQPPLPSPRVEPAAPQVSAPLRPPPPIKTVVIDGPRATTRPARSKPKAIAPKVSKVAPVVAAPVVRDAAPTPTAEPMTAPAAVPDPFATEAAADDSMANEASAPIVEPAPTPTSAADPAPVADPPPG